MKNIISQTNRHLLREFIPAIISALVFIIVVSIKQVMNPYLAMLITVLSLVCLLVSLVNILFKQFRKGVSLSPMSVVTLGSIIVSFAILILVIQNILILVPSLSSIDL